MLFNRRAVAYTVACISLIANVACSSKKKNLERQKINVNYKAYSYGAITGERPIEFNSSRGIEMLMNTKYNKPFFALAPHFSGQDYPTTCGPATARIVLSAIYEKEGRSFLFDPVHSLSVKNNGVDRPRYMMTEANIFIPYNNAGGRMRYGVVAMQEKDDNGKYEGGIGIQGLANILRSHPGVEAKYVLFSADDASNAGSQHFRELLKKIMVSNDVYLIANYHLSAMYDRNSGHYSPIVAYNEDSDYVLVMDVASHLGVWVWIKLEDLYRLMNGTLSGVQRGYIVVKRSGSKFDFGEVKNYDDGIRDLVQKQIDEAAVSDKKQEAGNGDVIVDIVEEANGADVGGGTNKEQNNIKISTISTTNDDASAKKIIKLHKVNTNGNNRIKKVKIKSIKSSNGKK